MPPLSSLNWTTVAGLRSECWGLVGTPMDRSCNSSRRVRAAGLSWATSLDLLTPGNTPSRPSLGSPCQASNPREPRLWVDPLALDTIFSLYTAVRDNPLLPLQPCRVPLDFYLTTSPACLYPESRPPLLLPDSSLSSGLTSLLPSVPSDVEPQDLTLLAEPLSGRLSLPPHVHPVLREFRVEIVNSRPPAFPRSGCPQSDPGP